MYNFKVFLPPYVILQLHVLYEVSSWPVNTIKKILNNYIKRKEPTVYNHNPQSFQPVNTAPRLFNF